MIIKSSEVEKTIEIKDGKIVTNQIKNLITDSVTLLNGYEFAISYKLNTKPFTKLDHFTNDDMEIVEQDESTITFQMVRNEIKWKILLKFTVLDKVIKKELYISSSCGSLFIDYIDLDSFNVENATFKWTIPKQTKRVLIPAYITTLGQPFYVNDLFFGLEFPMADNRIDNDITQAKYHIGRYFKEIAPKGLYKTKTFVIGAGEKNTFEVMRKAFFSYVKTFSRPARFRVQFNSWYDHMLDINSNNIKESFTSIGEGFKNAGFRPLDCYVVDDGWIDYKHPKFWEFNKDRFPNEFYNESKLTKELNSTFGVWFGPRGGYTAETVRYANRLTRIGYHKCNQSFDICTGDPKYIKDLCNRMAEFTEKYNVSYFKIDGFAITPCHSSHHGHPKGKGDGLYFYTFLWEEWIKGFEYIRSKAPNVFLNITSYAHCSPWFLKWVDAVWINNCQDMGFIGKGSNLDQCLNYRDSKYKDFFDNRELQFPTAYIYNHEPTYAEQNCNPTMPKNPKNVVKYSYEEFEKYLYMCMMRGTGFIELYFSPSMFDVKRYEIASKVLTWAENNFKVLQNSQFFGDVPEKGGIYGYYAIDGNKAIMSIRNSSDETRTYELINHNLCFKNSNYLISEYYPTESEKVKVNDNDVYEITLKPYEAKIYNIQLQD